MIKWDSFKYFKEKLLNIIFDILKICKKIKNIKILLNQNFYNFRQKKKKNFKKKENTKGNF